MGTWGTGPFENDDALDWAGALYDEAPAKRSKKSLAALDEAANSVEFMEIQVGAEAICASELVAAALAKPHATVRGAMDDPAGNEEGNSLGELARWAADPAMPVPALRAPSTISLATRALNAVLLRETSELAGLWAEAPEGKEWRGQVEDLIARLTP